MNLVKEILLIEDTDIGIAYKELLSTYNPSWHVTWVKTIAEIKALAFIDRLHVFIFDQRLSNNELGTDAFSYVHSINQRVQGIMLSGVAMAKDLAIAQKTAENSHVYHLVKDDVLRLPELVVEAISAYYTSIQRVDDSIDLSDGIQFRFFSHKPKITLINHCILDNDFVFENEWKVETRVRSGEDATDIESISIIRKCTIVKEVCSSIKVESGFDLKQIKNALSSHFESKLSKQYEASYEYKSQKEHTYKLPKIPASPSEDHPIEVRYEYNYVYKHIRAYVSICCFTCGIKSYCDFDVYIPVNRITWRQIAHYALGEVRTTQL